MVEYIETAQKSGHLGLFKKDKAYAWQNEFRFCFGVNNEGLNDMGAFELQIGDISDISMIVPVQLIIDEPLLIKHRRFNKVGEECIEVDKET